jgi:hypothetical protein
MSSIKARVYKVKGECGPFPQLTTRSTALTGEVPYHRMSF